MNGFSTLRASLGVAAQQRPPRLLHSPVFHLLLLDIAKPIQKKIMPKIPKNNIIAGCAPVNTSIATIPTRIPPNDVNPRPELISFYLLCANDSPTFWAKLRKHSKSLLACQAIGRIGAVYL